MEHAIRQALTATSEKGSKIGDFASKRSVLSKISGRRGRPTNHFCTYS